MEPSPSRARFSRSSSYWPPAVRSCSPSWASDFFPAVDAGQFRLHVRVPPGTRVGKDPATLQPGRGARSGAIIPANEIETVIDNIGLPNRTYSMAFGESSTTGMADGEILVALNHQRSRSTPEYMAELRRELAAKFPEWTFFFQSADIVGRILNFGLPAPIDIQVTGNDREQNRDLANGSPAVFAACTESRTSTCTRWSTCPRSTWRSTRPAPRKFGLTQTRRGQQCARLAQWKRPGDAELLDRSGQRPLLLSGNTDSAAPRRFARGDRFHAHSGAGPGRAAAACPTLPRSSAAPVPR